MTLTNDERAYKTWLDDEFASLLVKRRPKNHAEQSILASACADLLGHVIGALTGTGAEIAEHDPTLTDVGERNRVTAEGRLELTRLVMERVLKAAERAETMTIDIIKNLRAGREP